MLNKETIKQIKRHIHGKINEEQLCKILNVDDSVYYKKSGYDGVIEVTEFKTQEYYDLVDVILKIKYLMYCHIVEEEQILKILSEWNGKVVGKNGDRIEIVNDFDDRNASEIVYGYGVENE